MFQRVRICRGWCRIAIISHTRSKGFKTSVRCSHDIINPNVSKKVYNFDEQYGNVYCLDGNEQLYDVEVFVSANIRRQNKNLDKIKVIINGTSKAL